MLSKKKRVVPDNTSEMRNYGNKGLVVGERWLLLTMDDYIQIFFKYLIIIRKLYVVKEKRVRADNTSKMRNYGNKELVVGERWLLLYQILSNPIMSI